MLITVNIMATTHTYLCGDCMLNSQYNYTSHSIYDPSDQPNATLTFILLR